VTGTEDTQIQEAAAQPTSPAGTGESTEVTEGEVSAPQPRPETTFDDAEAPPAGGAPAAATDGASEPVDADLEALVAKARERDEYLALAQRTQADFENYRRRMARENAQAGERGVAKVARELLPALDHLELALKSADEGHAQPASPAGSGLEVVKGFAMVRDELAAALARVGIEGFSPQGEAFDPNEHEAMAQVPADGTEPGTVVEVYQRGYRINGTVLRPARVVVAQ
jgi:molecular chaperone GrpE